jgi:hypothetical protein
MEKSMEIGNLYCILRGVLSYELTWNLGVLIKNNEGKTLWFKVFKKIHETSFNGHGYFYNIEFRPSYVETHIIPVPILNKYKSLYVDLFYGISDLEYFMNSGTEHD